MRICTSKPKSSPKPNFHHTSDEIESGGVRSQDKENPISSGNNDENATSSGNFEEKKANEGKKSPFFPFYNPSPIHYLFSKKSPTRSPAPGTGTTPMRFFKRPFPPPSPAKHIKAVLTRRHGSVKPNEAAIPERKEVSDGAGLDKSFGFSKKFYDKYKLGEEVGRGQLKVNVFRRRGRSN